jgi:predicted TIM-barrel fold metal-dependent hydrolase
MSPKHLLDTHIHLWPLTAVSPTAHAWMSDPNHILSKPHLLSTYVPLSSASGVVYVETDRFLPSPVPRSQDIAEWAAQPLAEIEFMREVVEGEQGGRVKGCVFWCPMTLGEEGMRAYLQLAEERAGSVLWQRIVGFRYLLQGKNADEIRGIVQSENWRRNLEVLGSKGWSFDVGVDGNRDGFGVWAAAGEMGKTGRLILSMLCFWRLRYEVYLLICTDHLCKPPLANKEPAQEWIDAMRRFKDEENVYMKLSGAFNEFADGPPSTTGEMVEALRKYLDVVFECFPGRVMFGSDWPVCNVGGPKGEQGNWEFWREIVEAVMEDRGFSAEEKERVWWGAGCEAYGIEM